MSQTTQLDTWEIISAFPLDDPDASLTFSRRLHREQYDWSESYTQRVVQEYRRFFHLMCISPRAITPSEQVDQAWHLHILYSRNYEELCRSSIGKMIYHGPTKGGSAQGVHFREQYLYTLDFYRKVFKEEPPSDIWPDVDTRFSNPENLMWVDTEKYLVIPRQLLVKVSFVAAALLFLTLVSGLLYSL